MDVQPAAGRAEAADHRRRGVRREPRRHLPQAELAGLAHQVLRSAAHPRRGSTALRRLSPTASAICRFRNPACRALIRLRASRRRTAVKNMNRSRARRRARSPQTPLCRESKRSRQQAIARRSSRSQARAAHARRASADGSRARTVCSPTDESACAGSRKAR